MGCGGNGGFWREKEGHVRGIGGVGGGGAIKRGLILGCEIFCKSENFGKFGAVATPGGGWWGWGGARNPDWILLYRFGSKRRDFKEFCVCGRGWGRCGRGVVVSDFLCPGKMVSKLRVQLLVGC